MKLFYLIFLITFCYGCNYGTNDKMTTHKILEKGDYWVGCYNELNINEVSTAFRNNKLYCGTYGFGIYSDSTMFYCLDLLTGKVLSATNVSATADCNTIVLNDVVYYTTYLGDMYSFDTFGNQKWHNHVGPNFSFKSQTYNTINHNLIVSDVLNGFYEFNKKTGAKVSFTSPCDTCETETSLPVFTDKYIYFANHVDTIERPHHTNIQYNALVCQDYKTRKTVWTKPIKNVSQIYSKGGNICFTDEDFLYSLNGKNGNLNWRIKLSYANRTEIADFLYTKKSQTLTYNYKNFQAKVKMGFVMGDNEYNNNTELIVTKRISLK